MNPLDLVGAQYLLFHVVAFALALAFEKFGAAYLMSLGTSPKRAHELALQLSPYEFAFLEGRAQRVAEAAVASLIRKKLVKFDGHTLIPEKEKKEKRARKGRKKARKKAAELSLDSFENVLHAASKKREFKAYELGALIDPSSIERSLSEKELLYSGPRFFASWLLFRGPVYGVLLLGCFRLYLGLSAGRPVLFLILLLIASLFALSIGFVSRNARLAGLVKVHFESENRALMTTALTNSSMLSPSEAALAAAVWGAWTFGGASALTALGTAVIPPVPDYSSGFSSNCGSSCGSSCGGGCGGGCGGCGGCGG